MFPIINYRLVFVNKTRKNAELIEFLHSAHCEGSLEIIQAGFNKCCIFNALDGTEDNVVRGAENVCEASPQDDLVAPTRMQFVTSTSET